MIKGKEDITDKEFEEILLPFYLANGYSRNCLSDCPLINHINSALDIFNVSCNVDELMPEIELVLKIKYNLKIAKNNPLKLIEVV